MTDTQTPQPVAVERGADVGDNARRDDIRRSIIRQLGGDHYADRIILQPTDWDIVLEALAECARLTTDRSVGVELSLSETDTVEDVARYWHQEALKARAMLAATPPVPATSEPVDDLPTDRHGHTVLDRMRDHAENGTMPPEFREDLRALLALAVPATSGEGEKLREAFKRVERLVERVFTPNESVFYGSKGNWRTDLDAIAAALATPDAATGAENAQVPATADAPGFVVLSLNTNAVVDHGSGSDVTQTPDAAPIKVRRSPEMIAEFNATVRDGTQQIDPRQDSGHPLHDIVCGWCGEIHDDAAPIGSDDADYSGYVDAGDAK
jgi:hypothetical protein